MLDIYSIELQEEELRWLAVEKDRAYSLQRSECIAIPHQQGKGGQWLSWGQIGDRDHNTGQHKATLDKGDLAPARNINRTTSSATGFDTEVNE